MKRLFRALTGCPRMAVPSPEEDVLIGGVVLVVLVFSTALAAQHLHLVSAPPAGEVSR